MNVWKEDSQSKGKLKTWSTIHHNVRITLFGNFLSSTFLTTSSQSRIPSLSSSPRLCLAPPKIINSHQSKTSRFRVLIKRNRTRNWYYLGVEYVGLVEKVTRKTLLRMWSPRSITISRTSNRRDFKLILTCRSWGYLSKGPSLTTSSSPNWSPTVTFEIISRIFFRSQPNTGCTIRNWKTNRFTRRQSTFTSVCVTNVRLTRNMPTPDPPNNLPICKMTTINSTSSQE